MADIGSIVRSNQASEPTLGRAPLARSVQTTTVAVQRAADSVQLSEEARRLGTDAQAVLSAGQPKKDLIAMLRERIAELRDALGSATDGTGKLAVTVAKLGTDSQGELSVTFKKTRLSKEEVESHLNELQSVLNDLGDDAQQTEIDIQGASKSQQEATRLMSGILKSNSETLKAIIDNIGG